MRKKIVTAFLFSILFTRCTQKNVALYKVEIERYSPFSGTSSTELKNLNVVNDTAAFLKAVQEYWSTKLLFQKAREDYYNKYQSELSLEEPYRFTVYKYTGEDSSVIEFDSITATRLAKPIIEKTKSEVLQKLKEKDSISNKPAADIY